MRLVVYLLLNYRAVNGNSRNLVDKLVAPVVGFEIVGRVTLWLSIVHLANSYFEMDLIFTGHNLFLVSAISMLISKAIDLVASKAESTTSQIILIA
jgi:hypothetical protein